MAIKLVIDSASDISEKEAKEKGIVMIPMTITFGDEDFWDGVNLLPTEFYEKLVSSEVLPKTSQINSYKFEEVFKEHTANGDELIVITISSKLSGTYNSAVQASAKFNGKVHVVDSLNACIGERLLGDYALRLIKEGLSASQIEDELNIAKTKINLMATIETLEYLKKGGRISSTVAFVGKLLSIKPVIAVKDGEVKMVGKAMGAKRGNELLNKMVAETGGIDFNLPYGVIYSGLTDDALQKYLKDSEHLFNGDVQNVPRHILGGTIGTHIGPGAVGIAFFAK